MTVALPVLMVLGVSSSDALPEHSVTTAIEIDASPEEVWPHVVGFSELPPPQDWLLNCSPTPRQAGASAGGRDQPMCHRSYYVYMFM